MSLTLPFQIQFNDTSYPLTAHWRIKARPDEPTILKIRVPFPESYPESSPARDAAPTDRVAYLEMSFGDENVHDETDKLADDLDINPALIPDQLFSDKYAYLRHFIVYPSAITEPSEERDSVRGLGRILLYLALEIGIDQDLIDPDSLVYLEAYSDRIISSHPVFRRVTAARARYLETTYPKEWQRMIRESERTDNSMRSQLIHQYLSRLKNNECLVQYYKSIGFYPVIHPTSQSTESEQYFDAHSVPLCGEVESILLNHKEV